jgi:lipopolysaccharide/colanic/teichoic acid biosynthesis glycosyltransferase
LAIAVALLVLALPLIVIIALAVKCDSGGPVLIWEKRIAARGLRFSALKFRSTADLHTTEVTRSGWLLRYTRADRLPQLINVIRGEMSCIDAAPDRPFFLD